METFDFGRTDYRVVISLREDFLPDLESLKTIMPALMQKRMRLTRMTGRQALDAVRKPGAKVVDDDVARAIVEFVAGARGGSDERLEEVHVEPSLLSVVCRELNERRKARGQGAGGKGQEKITMDQVVGDRREILNDFYERSVADIPEAMRLFVEDKLLTKSGFRDNLALESALDERGVTQPLIDLLVSRRLLHLEDRPGGQRVELTHDVLAEVIRASRDARQQRVALSLTARAARRHKWVIAGLGTAVVGLLIGAFFGIRAQRLATQQASRGDMILGSRLLDEGRIADGLAYLVSAGQKDPANPVIAPRILTALAGHNFTLPVGSPLALPSPGLTAGYLADGRRILVQSEDEIVRLIDTAAWRIERTLSFTSKVKRGGIAAAEKNGDVFAVALTDETLLVLDAATGQPRFAPIHPPDDGKIASRGRTPVFALSPDGRWLVAAGGGTLWLWDATTGTLRASLPSVSGTHWFAFSPDGSRIATVSRGITQMWSVPEGTPVGSPINPSPGQNATDYYPRFSGDGSRIFAWNSFGVLICDGKTGEPVRPLLPINSQTTRDLALTNDGRRIVHTQDDSTVVILDVETGRPALPPLVHGGLVYNGELKAEGRILATNSVDGIFRFWDLETGRLLAEPTQRQEQYRLTAFSPDGSTAAVFAPSGLVYRFRTGLGPASPLQIARNAVPLVNLAATPPARLMIFTPTGAKALDIASGRETEGGFNYPEPLSTVTTRVTIQRSRYGGTVGAGNTVFVRDQADNWRAWALGEQGVAKDVVLAGMTQDLTPGPNHAGKHVAANTTDGIGIWNVQTGERVATINQTASLLTNAVYYSFSPDDRSLAYQTTDTLVHVCDIAGGKERFVLQLSSTREISAYRFSPRREHILTADNWGGVQVWSASDGRLLRSVEAHRTAVFRFDFSDDGRYYASLSQDGSVQVWDAETDDQVGPPLAPQTGLPARAYFSPDNSRILTPSTGGTVRVWDIRSGEPLSERMNSGEIPNVVAFSPDGRFLDIHSAGTTARNISLWAAPPDGRGARTPNWLLRLATIAAGQRLTDDGKLVVATDEIAQIDEVRRQVAALPANDPYAEWANWFLSDSPGRSIAPGFTITPAEAKKLAAPAAP